MTTITIGDGEILNALGKAHGRALGEAAMALKATISTTAAVICGPGRCFCSGSDSREFVHASADGVRTAFVAIAAGLLAVGDIPVPTVAAIEGVAAVAVCQLALACDLQLMGSSARIGMPTSQLEFSCRRSSPTGRIGPSGTGT
ncbi:MAG: enoyl-CoA hydratase/isomerase family protein [Actinomycetota bacterium]|nr:enoyl-CoA hydratase/isomerase family protein [Actinomycetota bacterium]